MPYGAGLARFSHRDLVLYAFSNVVVGALCEEKEV